ncbi:MAG: tRNA (guanosine(37)-N1)-methyltransferase TrmD, partial [Pseudomonadales bacterium]
MWFGVVSLFPEMFDAIKGSGVSGRAVKNGLIDISVWNPRDFTTDKHRTVDDRPFGGGPGMLMKVQPLQDAIAAAKAAAPEGAKVVYMSPQGRKLNHSVVQELGSESALILVAGRYEGIDERLIETDIDMEISLGDFVLSGGELPAMTRALPTSKASFKSVALMLAVSVFIAICAQIQLPIGPVPMTMQPFAIYLIGLMM